MRAPHRRPRFAAWAPSAFLPLAVAAVALALALAACGQPGAPHGAACTTASQCASRFCLTRGDAATCTRPCTSSADCPAGEACGRFDYRGTDVDGARVGGEAEVVRVCRPRLNAPCGAGTACRAGEVCVGEPGVCTAPCNADSACASRLCIASPLGCGAPGSCAPQCDDAVECPRSWYCNLANVDVTGRGRCEPVTPPTPSMCDAGRD